MKEKVYADYCKLLNETVIPSTMPSVDRNEAMRPLRNWIQKYTPKKLFKFRECTDRNIEAFRNQQIWFATGSLMNDDFDASLFCNKKWLLDSWQQNIDSDGILKQIKFLKQERDFPTSIKAKIDANILATSIANMNSIDWAQLNSEIVHVVGELINLQLPFIDQVEQTTMKISSFSEDITSPSMWGHYANSSTGFALAYDFRNGYYNEKYLPISTLLPVVYRSDRIDATFHAGYIMQYTIAKLIAAYSNFPNELFDQYVNTFIPCPDIFMQYKVLFQKSFDWAPEKEWRMTLSCSQLSNSSSITKKPCALYLGRKISSTYELILRNIAYKQKIPVYKMTIDDASKNYALKPIPQKNTKKHLLCL